ncbi:hypothetical protein [Clostridioides difficile]|uniref:hypothetical protein n=1 Tax=Clostridioides difficile TaxID=1496 RepID=UPI0030D1ACBF
MSDQPQLQPFQSRVLKKRRKSNVLPQRPLQKQVSQSRQLLSKSVRYLLVLLIEKATQPAQPAHRQNVEKVVSQETRQNYTKDRRTKVQQTQSVQKNQQTTEKIRNLVTKKGQKKK